MFSDGCASTGRWATETLQQSSLSVEKVPHDCHTRAEQQRKNELAIRSCNDFLRKVRKSPENIYIIHYSCQNLNDNNENLSPRITSIAVTHYSTEQSVSFSTHAVAEELGLDRSSVIGNFDAIERELLRQFYEFIGERRSSIWVHWNMRNATYGFEHLEHRFRVLHGDESQSIPSIPVEHRVNLSDMLADRFGSAYAPHPKMQSLMELNGGRHRDFLTGEEEVDAFHKEEFMKLHKSTLCKVGFFHSVIRKLVSGKLKTASRGWGVLLDKIFESRPVKAVGLFGTIIGIVLGVKDFILLI